MEIINVLAAAVGAFAFGAVWYIAMSKPWMAAAGMAVDGDGRPQGNGSMMPFVVGIVAMILVAGMMRHVFALAGIVTLGRSMLTSSPASSKTASPRALLRRYMEGALGLAPSALT